MRREMAVEPVARLATEESVVSQKADFSTFTMSNTLSKRIVLIVRYIQSGSLLDCPLFATKQPFHPRSSRCSFSERLYTRHFPKHALLNLPRSLMTQGKVHQNSGESRHFPRGRRRQVRRERLVEPVARQDTGESEPESWGIAALSPGVETEGAARVACGADAPARHGGKCTRIAGNRGTFPGRRKRQVQREGPVKPVPRHE